MDEKKESILVFWDANVHGTKPLINADRELIKKKQGITTVLYLVCEYIYNDDECRDVKDDNDKNDNIRRNAKERIEFFKEYFSGSINFVPFIIPEDTWAKGDADNLVVIEKTITDLIFPKILEFNPYNVHLTLTSGTPAMRWAWISLYTKSTFTRTFGEHVYIWQHPSDRAISSEEKKKLYKLDINKNPFIDAIEHDNYENKKEKIEYTDLDKDGAIKRNAAVNVPLLLLGERGTGKSTIVASTIMPVKRNKGYITESHIETVVCGQLDSGIANDELFGHVKGAYSDANSETKGAIEKANNGILFLDEIQDLPRKAQRELLRAFQEKRFRKLGSRVDQESNFNLICASNQSLSELQKKLDPDFFDRIATFKTCIKPIREQDIETLEDIWIKTWKRLIIKGLILPPTPDDFSLVKDVLIESKMKGNIRDIEQLIAYIARDVYQGTINISEIVKEERYKTTTEEWFNDYNERYTALEDAKSNNNDNSIISTDNEKICKSFLEENSWKDINNVFKQWLATTAIEYFGSKKEAAEALHCYEKTLYNAKERQN